MSGAWNVVSQFEREVAEFAGSRFAVAVDTCTWAIFLSLKWTTRPGDRIVVPCRTYLSVPVYATYAGLKVEFEDVTWRGCYSLKPYPVIDSACRFRLGMHTRGTFRCLSFQTRKHLAIGRGGMILHDDAQADRWFRLARFLGKPEEPQQTAVPEIFGWHCFMEPDRAASGLQRLAALKVSNPEPPDLVFEYPDLSKFNLWATHDRPHVPNFL